MTEFRQRGIGTLTGDETDAFQSVKSLFQTLEELLNKPIVGAGQSRDSMYANIQSARGIISEIDKLTDQFPVFSFVNKAEIEALLLEGEWLTQPLFLKQDLRNTLLAIVDTETTGLTDTDQPISVGAILLEVDSRYGDLVREIDSYYGLREPTVPIHPQAEAVHGMSIESLRGMQFDMGRLYKIIDSAELLVAHNAKFDRRMLAHVMPRVMHADWACTMYTLKYEWANISNGQWALDAICSALQIERPEPHNALSDCRALQSVLMTRSGTTERSKRLMGKVISNAWAPGP